jgi:hypothetical protein
MNKRVLGIGLAVSLLFSVVACAASAAEGAVIGPDKLADKDRAALVAAVAAAKTDKPASFELLARLRRDMPALDAQKRGRFVPVAAILKGMGQDALLPMLNEIALDGQARGDWNETTWIAWRVGLVEAVGSLRDGHAEPVLVAILNGPEESFEIVRAGASALGKLGTDTAAQKLVALAKQSGPKQKGVLAGMGDCRRTVVAEALADALARAKDAETAALVARSLGDVGSSWAWKTPIVAASGEEQAVRFAAAKALVASYLRHEGDARSAITKAILIVDHPSTPALVEAQKRGASAADLRALDALAERFKASPIHR